MRAGWRRWGSCMRAGREDDDERTGWLVDGYESLAAEVAAELGISRGRARGQLRYAIHLREKLPQLMRVFVTGAIDMRMVITIVNRVVLITDGELMAQLDAQLAQWAPRWMRLSGPKLEERIDWWVERIDPAGRRVPEAWRWNSGWRPGPRSRSSPTPSRTTAR